MVCVCVGGTTLTHEFGGALGLAVGARWRNGQCIGCPVGTALPGAWRRDCQMLISSLLSPQGHPEVSGLQCSQHLAPGPQ